ncbi:hypothetical protein VNO78_02735 [Psophocarpus tetragonolobus]|uniref:Secreted protein n=1 Tax=Psophocarpus tetragonolobus TaxID=3891 RepID=A0AAN9XVX4_PSOTE
MKVFTVGVVVVVDAFAIASGSGRRKKKPDREERVWGGLWWCEGEGLFYWVRLIKRANKCRGRCVGPTACAPSDVGYTTWRPLIEGFPRESVPLVIFVWHRRLARADIISRDLPPPYCCFFVFLINQCFLLLLLLCPKGNHSFSIKST